MSSITGRPWPSDFGSQILQWPRSRDLLIVDVSRQSVEVHSPSARLGALEPTTYARRLMYRIDLAADIGGYRVEPRVQREAATQPVVASVCSQPEMALAFALDQVLQRLDRADSAGAGLPPDREAAARAA